MPIVALNPEQLLVASSVARTSPGPGSPLRPLALQLAGQSTPRTLQAALQELVREKLVVPNREGHPRLAKALEPVIAALHLPEQTISFLRYGLPDVSEVFHCRVGKRWVRLSLAASAELQVLAWPLRDVDLGDYFADELLADVPVVAGGLAEARLRLALPDLALLVAMSAVYKRKASVRAGLAGSELWLRRRSLADPDIVAAIHPQLARWLDVPGLTRVLGDAAALDRIIPRLVEAGLVFAEADRLAFTRLARTCFDPGRQRAVVAVSAYGRSTDVRTVFVQPDQWLLWSARQREGVEWVELHLLPGDTPAREALAHALRGLDPGRVTQDWPARAPTTCPACGTVLTPGQRFCGQCGHRLLPA